MDAANQRPQLPALTYLNIEKVKREEEACQSRNTCAPQTLPAAATASPTYQYPPGPPPPYSHPAPPVLHHANSLPLVQPSTYMPPARTSGDDKDAFKQSTRQSLPSISEALGVDSQTSYYTSAPTSAPPVPAPQAPTQSAAPSSPSPTKRSYAMEPPQAPQQSYPNASSHHYYAQYRQDTPQQQSYPPAEAPRPAYVDARQPLHVQTSSYEASRPPPQLAASSFPPGNPSPVHEQSTPQSAGSTGPSSFPYGYTPYPPRYAQPTPPLSLTANPVYQPSVINGAPPTPTATWKSECASSRFATDERSYGDSVKRHLDLYDLEAALNDIAQTSGIMKDFSRRYGDRLHQTARSGPTLSTLPSIIEVEDMISKSRLQLDALSKIRDVVLTQQAAYDQQIAEQRQQHKAFIEAPPPETGAEMEESKEFAGGDTKKRRGRAAPPGRCHSCNRAETPEWRRGPDGARTLCNACGLHYAKLTRKQNNANKSAPVGSSNLRPKGSI